MPLHRRRHAKRLPRKSVLAAVAALVLAGMGLMASALVHTGGSEAPVAAPTTTTTTRPLLRTWTSIENDRAGTSSWSLDAGGDHRSKNGEIEGFAGAVSAQAGDIVNLYVSSTAPSWTVSAYRMGWYGGALARLVWTSPVEPGIRQVPPTRDRATNMVETTWQPSLAVTIGSDWLPGDYLFRLESSAKAASWIPLTLRDDASHAPILINNSVTTWQAYNLWGGADLYSGAAGRSDVVSFDRPYQLGDGSGDFLGNEEKFVKLVEQAGLDVSYTTDVDLHSHPELLLRHRVLVSLGHDEYWSTAMRDGVQQARDHGMNLLFLGANAIYRHIRMEPSPLGPFRHEVNYRNAFTDPVTALDPAEATVQWRDPPVSRPENALLGEMYECNPVSADLVVREPGAWVFAGAGLSAGQRLSRLVGSEYDHWTPNIGGPPVEDMARSPVTCRRRSSTSDFTYYVAAGGGGVIDTGTNLWVPNILENTPVGAAVAEITLTMLREAQRGPLGRTHPAKPTTGISRSGEPPPTAE